MSIYSLLYFFIISGFAVILTIADKHAARMKARRVAERTLFIVSMLGGSAAMFITMRAIRHKTRHKRFMLGIPLIMIVQTLIVLFAFSTQLEISRYTIETDKINSPVKLALITDLHSCNYGSGQKELIDALDSELPDAILLSGDIYDDKMPPEKTTEFIQSISSKYPCYYVTGNHEFRSKNADYFKTLLESYGVIVLEGTSSILKVSDEQINIGGIDDPNRDNYPGSSQSYTEQLRQLNEEFAHSGLYKILLSHRPERIDELLPLKPDAVLSGHAHGGQWRLPILLENGLYAPHQGLLPRYTTGPHAFGDTTLFVSRGLAKESTKIISRVFNRPEIVMLTLQ